MEPKELANKIFVAHSQISRLESGETTNIGSALLVSLAKVFHVSTDYLLCLTPISVPKAMIFPAGIIRGSNPQADFEND